MEGRRKERLERHGKRTPPSKPTCLQNSLAFVVYMYIHIYIYTSKSALNGFFFKCVARMRWRSCGAALRAQQRCKLWGLRQVVDNNGHNLILTVSPLSGLSPWLPTTYPHLQPTEVYLRRQRGAGSSSLMFVSFHQEQARNQVSILSARVFGPTLTRGLGGLE